MQNYNKYITSEAYDTLSNYENSNIINLAPVGTQGYIIKKSMYTYKINEILSKEFFKKQFYHCNNNLIVKKIIFHKKKRKKCKHIKKFNRR